MELIIYPIILFVFIAPVILTIFNIINLIIKRPIKEKLIDSGTFILGIILMVILFSFLAPKDYNQPIILGGIDFSLHTPIASWHMPTVKTLFVIAILGYLILRIKKNKIPPIIIICCISAIYIGVIIGTIFVIQLWDNMFADTSGGVPFGVIYLTLFPINYILCSIRLLRQVIYLQTKYIKDNKAVYKNFFLKYCNNLLSKSLGWYVIAFVATIPLLAIILIILVLFGQAPDAVIKAFTETSDWTLSQKTSPPPIEYKGHYLCTVALNGHKKLVKPTRCGMRHGQKIIVNRQLCIANAFEQLIQEKTPLFHKIVRNIYDKYGYPLSKHITTAVRADIIYVIMKPLEYIFLFVLYLFDLNPENRISMQYTGDFNK